ncbi:hypothetical protein HUN39_11065 [Methylocystis sp. FS]|uniref:hypothetical protein n=1 Tax=Methylocystis silviterrae TaxID=2743612 RepID=UPI001583112F|nr:hypothetical protein [Methylocystis silviterrae]NUJ80561.1 hypothetical protein [Methylocystis silviterrae]
MTPARLGFDFIDRAEAPGAAFDSFAPKPAQFLKVCPLHKALGAPLCNCGANGVILGLELAGIDRSSKLGLQFLWKRNV